MTWRARDTLGKRNASLLLCAAVSPGSRYREYIFVASSQSYYICNANRINVLDANIFFFVVIQDSVMQQ